MFFTLFWNFNFQVQYWGKRAKHDLKWQKIVCCTPYLGKHTSYDCVYSWTSLKWWASRCFFHFFKILVFWIVRGGKGGGRWGVKRQKMAQNDKKNSVWLFTSYDCGFWYICVKWWYLQQFSFVFSKFWFFWFFKVINECQEEILKCVPSSSHVCDFFLLRRLNPWKFLIFIEELKQALFDTWKWFSQA